MVIEYGPVIGPARTPATDDRIRIRPDPRSSICGMTACDIASVPNTFDVEDPTDAVERDAAQRADLTEPGVVDEHVDLPVLDLTPILGVGDVELGGE